MKTDFRFSNLLGTVYSRGNLLFTPDGNSLLSPVGNRVTVFDLVNNKSHTLPFSHRRNIARLALNPRGNLLLSIDDDGHAILTNVPRRIVLYHFSLRGAVTALTFAPSGRHFAVAIGRQIEVWHTPSTPEAGTDGELEFAPFVRHRVYTGHFDVVQSFDWSSDSRFFLSASKDLTARIWSLDPEEAFVPTTLAGHKQAVRGAWFSKDQETIYTASKDGAVFQWKYLPPHDADPDDEDIEDDQMRWRIAKRHYFMQAPAHVSCAAYHAPSNLLVAGFSNGVFGIYEMPDFNAIHNLSISQTPISHLTISPTGAWLAFGSTATGQLLVWDWQSESHILKQSAHHDALNALVYSPSGSQIITTADDGKIKVWDTGSGFCSVTFTEHSSGVTAAQYAKRGHVLFTASLDGSVRAWDLLRYRNFRTFTAPSRLSFTSLAVDPAGEVVCAGSLDSFDIHIWSVQTGQLLDRLSGHEGPVSTLAFTPDGSSLVSGSWDKTVRIWSIFARTQTSEPIQLQADVLCVATRPDGKQIAVSTLDGAVTFWSVNDALQTQGVDGRRDASGGRKLTDRRTAANVAGTKSFNTLAYSADGSCVLAGGNSKFICLYEVTSGVLLKKFTVSVNLSIEGTQEFLNSRNLTAAGARDLIDMQGEASDLEDRIDKSLPGAQRGDAGERKTRPAVRVTGVAFSPTGRSFCAASTEGLLVYSLDSGVVFDPFDLDVDVTPASTLKTLNQGEYLKALAMAFRLNSPQLIKKVYEATPVSDIPLVVRDLPEVYLGRLMRFIAGQIEGGPHLEFGLKWSESIVVVWGRTLRDKRGEFEEEVRLLRRAVEGVGREVKRIGERELWEVEFLLAQKPMAQKGVAMQRRIDDVVARQIQGDEDVEDDDADDDEGEWMGLD
ncbi:WD40 repeat-like protein [Rhizodiscina lignyota]|uniref:WD40 repeat-like protein n=1 Tax=Rhizodiscina lignyota TaxID=1504668 RepID=A0A9P4I9B4_9PEZI|nr:WD40 repeat-like protein [Rhizodiscina lignyota]